MDLCVSDWSAFLTGRKDALKGKDLRYPTLFEYSNRDRNQKPSSKTLALYIDEHDPPAASKHKNFGRKFAPMAVRALEFEFAAARIGEALNTARQKGRSQSYIDQMIKPKLTPKALKIDKQIKEKPLQSLIARILLTSDDFAPPYGAFLRTLTGACMVRAQPDLLFVHLVADGSQENREFIRKVWAVLRTRPRYLENATLAVLDQSRGRAFFAGKGANPGLVIPDPLTLMDLSATLSNLANIPNDLAEGFPIRELVAR